MQGTFQLNNAATAIAGLQSIKSILPVSPTAITKGLQTAQVTGRLQLIQENPDWLLDVAHNPHAAQELAKFLQETPIEGNNYALFSMLKDKDVDEVLNSMYESIDEWHVYPTEGARGLSIQALKQIFNQYHNSKTNNNISEQIKQDDIQKNVIYHESFDAAFSSMKNITKVKDRVVAFGSFLVISEVLNTTNN